MTAREGTSISYILVLLLANQRNRWFNCVLNLSERQTKQQIERKSLGPNYPSTSPSWRDETRDLGRIFGGQEKAIEKKKKKQYGTLQVQLQHVPGDTYPDLMSYVNQYWGYTAWATYVNFRQSKIDTYLGT